MCLDDTLGQHFQLCWCALPFAHARLTRRSALWVLAVVNENGYVCFRESVYRAATPSREDHFAPSKGVQTHPLRDAYCVRVLPDALKSHTQTGARARNSTCCVHCRAQQRDCALCSSLEAVCMLCTARRRKSTNGSHLMRAGPCFSFFLTDLTFDKRASAGVYLTHIFAGAVAPYTPRATVLTYYLASADGDASGATFSVQARLEYFTNTILVAYDSQLPTVPSALIGPSNGFEPEGFEEISAIELVYS
eukprot:6212497-Pleurochrysis_carterae.AAC.2